MVSSWGTTGASGSSRGGLGGADSCPGLRCGSWSWHGRSVEQTTRFDKHVCSSSCGSVCWAVDRRCGLSGAWVAVSGVVVAVLVLDTALDTVSEVVVAGNAGVGSCDVAVAVGGSGPRLGGQRVCWGAMA